MLNRQVEDDNQEVDWAHEIWGEGRNDKGKKTNQEEIKTNQEVDDEDEHNQDENDNEGHDNEDEEGQEAESQEEDSTDSTDSLDNKSHLPPYLWIPAFSRRKNFEVWESLEFVHDIDSHITLPINEQSRRSAEKAVPVDIRTSFALPKNRRKKNNRFSLLQHLK